MTQKKDIYVYMDWSEFEEPIFMGVLSSELLRGKEVFSSVNKLVTHPTQGCIN